MKMLFLNFHNQVKQKKEILDVKKINISTYFFIIKIFK